MSHADDTTRVTRRITLMPEVLPAPTTPPGGDAGDARSRTLAHLQRAIASGAALAAAREHEAPEVEAAPEDRPVRLEVHDVSKRFGGIQALRDVSFDARAGEILGFIEIGRAHV